LLALAGCAATPAEQSGAAVESRQAVDRRAQPAKPTPDSGAKPS
jgi:hypothetical protein